MRKYLLHVLIISFVFLLAPTVQAASYNSACSLAWFLQDIFTGDDIETCKEEIRKNPDDADAHINLGIAYGELGKHKKEIESYKQAIRIDPDYANAHYNLGVAYLDLNRKSYALDQYKILKELDSELANTLFDCIYKK